MNRLFRAMKILFLSAVVFSGVPLYSDLLSADETAVLTRDVKKGLVILVKFPGLDPGIGKGRDREAVPEARPLREGDVLRKSRCGDGPHGMVRDAPARREICHLSLEPEGGQIEGEQAHPGCRGRRRQGTRIFPAIPSSSCSWGPDSGSTA